VPPPELAEPKAFIASHSFTPYMRAILAELSARPPGTRVLDLPAGHGQFTDALREAGLEAVPADLNGVREDYLPLDMAAPLPLEDASFDAVVCTEGLEHLLAPQNLVAELVRVTRPGGVLYLSVPNVHNFYSRLQFLFTGMLYQFQAYDIPDTGRHHHGDRGHVSPITLPQLRWWAHMAGADLEEVLPDKHKRKALKPLYWLLHQAGRPWRRRLRASAPEALGERNRELQSLFDNKQTLYSRSLVLRLRRRV